MGIPDVRPGEPEEAAEDTGRGVRSKADHEAAHKVARLLDPVVRRETVNALELLVNEVRHAHHPLAAFLRDQDVLRLQLDHLVGVLEQPSVDVGRIPEGCQHRWLDSDLVRPDVCHR
ncbi:hypothetical protein DSECCO2_609980 [anaerobic digester metagenome]